MKQTYLFRIHDIYLAAFLILLEFACTLEKNPEKANDIFFCFEPSDNLYKALQAFNEGCPVDVAAFSREIKRLRAIMYEAKQ
jgi:hypothetical protein